MFRYLIKASIEVSSISRQYFHSAPTKLPPSNMVKFLSQEEAINIDKDLFEKYKFSVDQLMELAGQSCAIAVAKSFPLQEYDTKTVLVCCGPGNNGGDGLVCARHLALLGYEPEIYYPKKTANKLYENLLHQCQENDISIFDNFDLISDVNYRCIVDALFGFSFKPPVRTDFEPIMNILEMVTTGLVSIDIPSGWDVENGPLNYAIQPEVLISLTAPKMCAKYFTGKHHYLGGRFVPKKLEIEYNLNLPKYPGTDLIVEL